MKSSKLNPVTTHKEFNGISGALGITIGLPTLTVLFYLLCNQTYSIQGINVDFAKIKSQLPITQDELWQLVFDKTCWLAYLAWFFILVVLDYLLPGKSLNGVKLRDGTVLNYKINGLSMSSLLIVLLLARLFQLNSDSSLEYYLPELQFIYDNQLQLIIICFCFLLC